MWVSLGFSSDGFQVGGRYDGVSGVTGGSTISDPSAPCPVLIFVAVFLTAVKDDTALCSLCVAQESTSTGS